MLPFRDISIKKRGLPSGKPRHINVLSYLITSCPACRRHPCQALLPVLLLEDLLQRLLLSKTSPLQRLRFVCRTSYFCRVNDSSNIHIDPFACCCVEADAIFFIFSAFDNNGTFKSCIFGNLTNGFFEGTEDNVRSCFLVTS